MPETKPSNNGRPEQVPIVTISFGRYVAGNAFEYLIAEALQENVDTAHEPRVCILNFEETEWIDIASTQYITAFTLAARKRNWLTVLKPPLSKEARDFWRYWNFPEAFEKATNSTFSRLVSGENRKYLREEQTSFSESRRLKLHAPEHPRIHERAGFFGFISESIQGSNYASVANAHADSWSKPEIQDVLNKHLGKRCDYLPTRVVFEAIFNATKHPGANLIQSASYHPRFVETSKDRNRDSDFVMFFWDNGNSMHATVEEALSRGIDLKSNYLSDFERNYDVLYTDKQAESLSYRKTVHSDIPLTADLEDEIVLLSTLFPGVSSKPDAGYDHEVHPEVLGYDRRLARRGMGLFVLVNAVAEVLGGSVSFRTGKYYMHVGKHKPREAKKRNATLKVQLIKMQDALPQFEGNLISIRIPSEA